MKYALLVALLVSSAATAASAQDGGLLGARSVSVDLGLGAAVGPTFPGSENAETTPWLIWRNVRIGDGPSAGQGGFAISPSFNIVGPRDAADDADLVGLNEIDRSYELGVKVSFGSGPVSTYGAVRKGVGGHEGLVGEVGAKYRTDLSDRMTLWSGLEVGYGNSDYNGTYFGLTPAESATSGYADYAPGGGFNTAAIKFEARYALTDSLALLGEVEYGKLIGDAADSPIVQEDYQPSLRLGIVRRFSFGF